MWSNVAGTFGSSVAGGVGVAALVQAHNHNQQKKPVESYIEAQRQVNATCSIRGYVKNNLCTKQEAATWCQQMGLKKNAYEIPMEMKSQSIEKDKKVKREEKSVVKTKLQPDKNINSNENPFANITLSDNKKNFTSTTAESNKEGIEEPTAYTAGAFDDYKYSQQGRESGVVLQADSFETLNLPPVLPAIPIGFAAGVGIFAFYFVRIRFVDWVKEKYPNTRRFFQSREQYLLEKKVESQIQKQLELESKVKKLTEQINSSF